MLHGAGILIFGANVGKYSIHGAYIYIYVYIHSFIRIYIYMYVYIYIYGLNLTIQQPRPFVNDSPDPNCTNPIMAGFEADSHPDVSHSTGLSYHTFSSFPTNAA